VSIVRSCRRAIAVDAELRRPVPGVGLSASGVGGPDPGIDPDAEGRAGGSRARAIQLSEQIDVQVHARREDGVEILRGQVRPRVADLLPRPSVVDRPSHLTRRAHVHPDALRRTGRAQRTEEREERWLALRLQRQSHRMTQTGPGERTLEPADLFLDADQIVHVQRRAVLARDRFGVPPGDGEPAGPNLETGPVPPRQLRCGSSHAGAKATRMLGPPASG